MDSARVIQQLRQLEKEKAQLSLEIVDLARDLAAAEMRAEQAYDSGFQHGREAALRDAAKTAAA